MYQNERGKLWIPPVLFLFIPFKPESFSQSAHDPARGTHRANDKMWPDWVIDAHDRGRHSQLNLVCHQLTNKN